METVEVLISFEQYSGPTPGVNRLAWADRSSFLVEKLRDINNNETPWSYESLRDSISYLQTSGLTDPPKYQASWAAAMHLPQDDARRVYRHGWAGANQNAEAGTKHRLFNLDDTKEYTIELFGSRIGQSLWLTVMMVGDKIASLTQTCNVASTARIDGIKPQNGIIDISFFGESGYWDIGALRIIETSAAFAGGEPEDGRSRVSGLVQIDGQPAARTVRAFSYDAIIHEVNGIPIQAARTLGEAKSDPETGAYNIDLLGGYSGEVFVVAFDDYGRGFAPNLPLAIGDRVHPTQPNGYVYECDAAGTLPEEEPVWSTDTNTSQLVGTASVIARPFYRPVVHGPVKPVVMEPEEEGDS